MCTERTQTTAFRHGITPLHFVARYNPEPAVAALLLDGGADVDPRESANGLTPLLYVTWFSPPTVLGMVALLLDNGADINASDKDGITPVHHAVFSEEVKVVALLLDRGADVNIRDAAGGTACRRAQRTGAFVGTPLLDRLCPT